MEPDRDESDHGNPNNEITSSSDKASQTSDNEATNSIQLPEDEQGPSGIQTGQRSDLKMVLRNRGSGRVKFRSIESKL